MKTENIEQHLNQAKAAQYMGISVGLLKKIRLDGGGPCYIRINKKILFSIKDLDAFLEKKKITTTGR